MSLTALILAATVALLPLHRTQAVASGHGHAAAKPAGLYSPILHVRPGPPEAPRIALTLDACTGKVDERILSALIEHRIRATVFVTARWLKRNPDALQRMLQHADLIRIENHGARHVSAIDVPARYYGVETAGSAQAIRREIQDGEAAIEQATGRRPQWYRGAAAEYNAGGLAAIRGSGSRLAGYSRNGDEGAGLSAARTAAAIAAALNGDVIIAHINQPSRPAGAGVVEGMLKLKAEGFAFVWLDSRSFGH